MEIQGEMMTPEYAEGENQHHSVQTYRRRTRGSQELISSPLEGSVKDLPLMGSLHEMHSADLDVGEDCIDDILSPGSPCTSGVYGDPQVQPRVGEQYQVEAPPLTPESDRVSELVHNGTVATVAKHSDCSMAIGLAIPIMWISGEADGYKRHKESSCQELVHIVDQKNSQNDANGNEKSIVGGNSDMVCLSLTSWHLVPGTHGGSWNKLEQDSFLLGLYIFGKNLVQVRRFVESKEMGDILSYYYGKFYRSDAHRRWAECRKIRSRKCIHGQRIFTGWRQQEILARLLPHTTEESGNTLIEVSKSFGEGRVSLEEYVSALKNTIGLRQLVDAIGIGKGKQDLTGILMEPIRTNQPGPTRSEIPVGKACSSLSSKDIIKFLTGDFRLSKARSNDLFWEAVWPRLLAKGWHSEQPKNQGYVGSKHPLVFLTPGIKKFSRRRLVKNVDYFDSVSDVLNKVALEPGLLELEVDGSKGNKPKEEYAWEPDIKPEQNENGSSNQNRHCYLRPRLPKCNLELPQFTVVDTSLARKGERFKVREMRSLPADTIMNSLTSLSRETTDGDSSDEQVEEIDSVQILQKSQESPLRDKFANEKSGETMMEIDQNINVHLHENEQESTPVSEENQEEQVRETKTPMLPCSNSDQTNSFVPSPKRQKISPCVSNDRGDGFSGECKIKKQEFFSRSNSCEVSPSKAKESSASLQKMHTPSSVQASPDNSGTIANCLDNASETERIQPPRALIDLNIPLDIESGEALVPQVADSHDELNPQPEANFSNSEFNRNPNDVVKEEKPTENVRRQSTRNRPLTTRALEALACGYLNTKRRARNSDKTDTNKTLGRKTSTRRRRREAQDRAPVVESEKEEASDKDMKVELEDEECSSSKNTAVVVSQIRSERRGSHGLLGVVPNYQTEISTGKDGRSD
ncbi:uncharacterized protein LOC18445307 isoform X1 [Amborella trichopoda]|nr:uncharacterized protein LOC18445307 isoform X1 [Amborella trichopoda]|eukprot:XP_006855508.2 uncharacterized protein LOC18445307 isoform X1 [Amborella trichopoda]